MKGSKINLKLVLRTFVVYNYLLSNVVRCEFSDSGNSLRSSKSVKPTDDYLKINQRECITSKSLASCIKYKASKFIWRIATNNLNYFPTENSRDFVGNRTFSFVYMNEPSSVELFPDARSITNDESEFKKSWKFLKRALQTFVQSHGVQIALRNDEARILDDETKTEIRPRGHLNKKKTRWLVILPLIILMKIAHLKMTVVPMLLATVGLNLVLVASGAYIIYFLKHKTLCKIHPHIIQSHSHVWDSEPEYSTFIGSSHSPGSGHYYGQDGGYSKDWASSKAYNGYNYLDTVSQRAGPYMSSSS